jgi:hypothetical protein
LATPVDSLLCLQSLRPTVSEVEDAIAAGTPAVIDCLVLREPPALMIAIVGDLVIQLVRRGMELEHPGEPPARLVEDVRGCAGHLMGEQQLRGRVARGEEILQLIARVVPPAGRIQIRARGQWAVRRAAVVRMTDRVEPWVVPATLLSHELEQRLRHLRVHVVAKVERRRLRGAGADDVSARFGGRGEI